MTHATLALIIAVAVLIPASPLESQDLQPEWQRSDAQPTQSPQPPTRSLNPWVNPGKIELLYHGRSEQDDVNFIWWTPSVKAGAGIIDVNGQRTEYVGGFARPFASIHHRGELILGVQNLSLPAGRHVYELQGEYRAPSGLGFGAGLVNHFNATQNVRFGKVSYRNRAKGLQYVVEVQAQEMAQRLRPGGYGALYTEALMVTAGTDAEQWRTALGYVSPWSGRKLKPTFEVLYVNNNIGALPGVETVFVNGTLKMRGQFLSHAARLGRAIGPQGLEYGNPLGFLVPTWNRRLDVWEIGSVFSFRLEGIRQASGAKSSAYEAVVFPYEPVAPASFWARLFGGASYRRTPLMDAWSVQGGYYGAIGPLTLSFQVHRDLANRNTGVGVGVLRFF